MFRLLLVVTLAGTLAFSLSWDNVHATPLPVGTIGVEFLPQSIDVDSAGRRVFVANSGADSISIIDAMTNAVTNVAVGSAPFGVAFDISNGLVYTANRNSNDVTVVNPNTASVVTTVAGGYQPFDIAFNQANGALYVADQGGNSVTVIDGSTNTVVTTITSGLLEVRGVAVDAALNKIYVTNTYADKVSVIDGATNTLIADIPTLPRPAGVAVDSASHRAFVTHFSIDEMHTGGLTAIDTNLDAIVGPSIPLPKESVDVAVDPADGLVLVSNWLGQTLTLASASDISSFSNLPRGFKPFGIGVLPSLNRMYVANNGGTSVEVDFIDPTKDTDGDGYNDGKEFSIGKNSLVYCPVMRADVNGDGVITAADLGIVAAAFGHHTVPLREDQNGDSNVTAADLGLVASVFGPNVAGRCT
jgi:YVTN family beta-propeller protein